MSNVKNYYENGKRIGWYKPEQKIYRKTVDKNKHLLKIMDAWGIQSTVIDELKDLGCEEIRIKETQEEEVYSIGFETFMYHAVERDFGAGKQRFVSRKFFDTV